ncbi:hypothetical protein I4U23_002413 [Adineta vaga]|nr:hypothetical protein I4U23_002413 [Adineta vaga]
MITKISIPCVWGGHLAGILLKSHTATTFSQSTTKIVGIHGWLDNINSLLPLAKKLLHHQPNYEICLYDRVGHGFSDHLPRGTDYSFASNLLDLRTVIKTLGWNNDKYSFIGHSYGGTMALIYAAAYPKEVSCLAILDPFAGVDYSLKTTWATVANRIEGNLKYFNQSSKAYKYDLTYEKATESMKSSRNGIDDDAAKMLVERSVRRNIDQKLHFTRDAGLKNLQIMSISQDIVLKAIEHIQASILFVGATKPQWSTTNSLIPLLRQHNLNFEMTLIDGSHHFHMTQVNDVSKRIEQYFHKHLKE